jgi:hypothetical protein
VIGHRLTLGLDSKLCAFLADPEYGAVRVAVEAAKEVANLRVHLAGYDEYEVSKLIES